MTDVNIFGYYEYLLYFITCSIINGLLIAMTKYSAKYSAKPVLPIILRVIEVVFLCYYFIEAIIMIINGELDAVFLEIITLTACTVLFYFIFQLIFNKFYNKKINKVIGKIKQTPLWNDLLNSLSNHPQCHVYVCADGIAVKKQPEYRDNYNDYDEIISLGKVLNAQGKAETKSKICRDVNAHFTPITRFNGTCETFSFSKYELTRLDSNRINLLSAAIVKMKEPEKYGSYIVKRKFTFEELVDDNYSPGSIVKTGDIYTVYAPTSGTPRYVTKTLYSSIKHAVVYPKTKKPSKAKKTPKEETKSWL